MVRSRRNVLKMYIHMQGDEHYRSIVSEESCWKEKLMWSVPEEYCGAISYEFLCDGEYVLQALFNTSAETIDLKQAFNMCFLSTRQQHLKA